MTLSWRVTLELELIDPSDEHNPQAQGAWPEGFTVPASDEFEARLEATRQAHAKYDDENSAGNLSVHVVNITPRE